LHGLKNWEYQLKPGLLLRGYYTPPSGKPLLHFIHGNGFCGLTYEHLLAELQPDFDLFISDAQGHGDSDPGAQFRGWDKSAALFIKIWQEHAALWKDVPKFAFGHSFGAVMSTLMIARQPELFDGGILMDPVYAPPVMAKTMSLLSGIGLMQYLPLSRQARIRTRSWPSYQAAWDYLHQRGTFKGWQDACLKSYLDHALVRKQDGSLHLKCPPEIEAAIFASYPKNLWREIQSIQKPMAMIYGQRTYPFVIDSLPRLHQCNAHYDFVEIPGGHCFMQEQPQLTAQEIKQKILMQLAYC